MNSWQDAAGISAAPKGHMPDCSGVALAEMKDLAPVKKKAEAAFCQWVHFIWPRLSAGAQHKLDFLYSAQCLSELLMGSVMLPGCPVWCTEPVGQTSGHLDHHKRLSWHDEQKTLGLPSCKARTGMWNSKRSLFLEVSIQYRSWHPLLIIWIANSTWMEFLERIQI